MKDMKYKIGDEVELVDNTDERTYIGEQSTYGRLKLRSIKKDGSLGKFSRGYEYLNLEEKRGRIVDLDGEKFIVGFLPSQMNGQPHPHLYSYKIIKEYGDGIKYTNYDWYDKGVDCFPSQIELVTDDLEIRKLEEQINNKEKEIEELKQQIETIKKEVN